MDAGEASFISVGELLLEEFLKLLGISQYRLAKEIDVPAHDERMQLDGTSGYKWTTSQRLKSTAATSTGI